VLWCSRQMTSGKMADDIRYSKSSEWATPSEQSSAPSRSCARPMRPAGAGDELKERSVPSKDAGGCWGVDEWVARCCLQDGTKVKLRLVEPSDVLACSAMLSACSRKSLYSRYERQMGETPAELAAQLCCLDLRCELSVVAEIAESNPSSVIGIAQLIADPDRKVAEYAVLVADPWQGKGLGSAFTDFCLRLAHGWGIRCVVAEFLPDNVRIIRILESRTFALHRDMLGHVVSGKKILTQEGARASATS
jgi:RimJ/RimL family protein N-acetyltransferase